MVTFAANQQLINVAYDMNEEQQADIPFVLFAVKRLS